MKRVVLDARMIGHTGIGRYLQCLIPELNSPSYQLELLGNNEKLSKIPTEKPAVIRPLNAPVYGLSELWAVSRAAAGAELLHCPHFNIPIGISKKTRLIVTIHDLIYVRVPESTRSPVVKLYAKRQLQRVARRADEIITVSQFTKNDFCEYTGCDPDKVTVIHSGISEELRPITDAALKKSKRQALKLPERYLLWVSAIKPHKDLPAMAEAFRWIARKDRNLEWVIVGKPDALMKPYLDRLLKDPELEQKIRWFPEIEPELLIWFYNLAELFVTPSRYEGFGFPPLEAMACGVPVVAAQSGSLPEILGDAAAWFPAGKIEALVETVYNVLSDPALRQRLVERGTEQTRSYSWQQTGRATRQIYERWISQGSVRP
jgi:glycosyltransferase involved in cell wall biosynthesis